MERRLQVWVMCLSTWGRTRWGDRGRERSQSQLLSFLIWKMLIWFPFQPPSPSTAPSFSLTPWATSWVRALISLSSLPRIFFLQEPKCLLPLPAWVTRRWGDSECHRSKCEDEKAYESFCWFKSEGASKMLSHHRSVPNMHWRRADGQYRGSIWKQVQLSSHRRYPRASSIHHLFNLLSAYVSW